MEKRWEESPTVLRSYAVTVKLHTGFSLASPSDADSIRQDIEYALEAALSTMLDGTVSIDGPWKCDVKVEEK